MLTTIKLHAIFPASKQNEQTNPFQVQFVFVANQTKTGCNHCAKTLTSLQNNTFLHQRLHESLIKKINNWLKILLELCRHCASLKPYPERKH